MSAISLGMLLEYLYTKFLVTFMLNLMGAFIRESVDKKVKRLNPKRMIASALFSSVLLCAAADYITVSFSLYVLLGIINGIWANAVLTAFLSASFMKKLAMNVFKAVPQSTVKAIGKTIAEMEDDKDEKRANDNNEKEDDSSLKQ